MKIKNLDLKGIIYLWLVSFEGHDDCFSHEIHTFNTNFHWFNYSLFISYYSNIRILFDLQKPDEYEYE